MGQRDPAGLVTAESEAIRRFEQAIAAGRHWYLGLLDAIACWTRSEETVGERKFKYIIDGEAFDWLLLAERLCLSVETPLPENEVLPLLFHGTPPLDLSMAEFKNLIGPGKYLQFPNFFYGVTVEAVLVLAIQEEVRKERRIAGIAHEAEHSTEAYRRIYGAAEPALLKKFRKEKGYPQAEKIELTELKEFTYWLFKYRIDHSDPSKVASDTKKALEFLKHRLLHRAARVVMP